MAAMTSYLVEIQAYCDDTRCWQTLHAGPVATDDSALPLAELVAMHQNVAEGDEWRVRVSEVVPAICAERVIVDVYADGSREWRL